MENSKLGLQKIHPCLWFNDNAEEAVNFYISLFKNSKIKEISRYGKNAPLPEGTALTISFELEGQLFQALNGGPHFKFTEAISLVVNCDTQKEIDEFWKKLSAQGEEQQCGWLKDKFGLSWQVVPAKLGELMTSKDPQKSGRVMGEIMKMKKLDLHVLEEAYNG
ncbi:MAG TPA: VOC family protein [Bacteroidia bacterium]|jgi:predicted 3-demethylubiquinone-9 3-methyltransferase (glyoxalase superfamily)|nr:VOC family protein [Bacteroidia bacterium]